MVRALAKLYLEKSDRTLAQLETAIQTGAVQEACHWAHKFCGSCFSCGVTILVPPLGELEALTRSGTVQGAEAPLARTREEYARVRKFFVAFLGSSQREL